ncbi:MAG: FlgD immunoglobulin-like domain containing protein, partial [Candidatus Eiseniibacteriota bacterium]
SDESAGGLFFYAWQVDDVALLVDGTPIDVADFESGMDGWEPRRFAGQDFELTQDPTLPAGRITGLDQIACPPQVPCPEVCGIEGNILLFADQDDCQLADFMTSAIVSPPFAIGGPSQPDIDGWAGRLLEADVYLDGGSGLFEHAIAICHYYAPAGLSHCPYTPPPGAPGAGTTFDWSRTTTTSCDFFSTGVGATCLNAFTDDVSAAVPADADSVVIELGAYAYNPLPPPPGENLTSLYDNVRFGVYDPLAPAIFHPTSARYSDSFPLAEQAHAGLGPGTSRSDGAQSYPCVLGLEQPPRHVRADTAYVELQTGYIAPSMYLRFRVEPGSCQSLANPFWAAFPAGSWHEARMDVARAQGSGQPVPGRFMTCFHPSDPHDGTSWGGEMSPVEPCDDILPDGVFSPGTRVVYFLEARSTFGAVLGTSPSFPDGAALDTTATSAAYWLEFETLPELDSQSGCDPTDPDLYVNDILVIDDSGSDFAAGRMRALLDHLQLDFDWYDVEGTNYTCSYNGIGRREDRNNQPPRPPVGGATAAQLEGYRCIWYFSGNLDANTLSDQLTLSVFGGQPSIDQQRLEEWLQACSAQPPHENRFLLLEGLGWASDVDSRTVHGPAFLAGLGVDVIDDSYCDMSGDLRRCARITGNPATAPGLDGEVYASGCPECLPFDMLATSGDGEILANYVHSLEGGNDPVDCTDDVNQPAWAAVVRRASGTQECQRSAALGISTSRLHTLNCVDECQFEAWSTGGALEDLVVGLFDWAGLPIGTTAAGEPPPAPPVVTRLLGARPNPADAQDRATIRFTLAARGHVRLRVYDVGGRHVRTLVDAVLDAAGHAVDWDGRDAQGRRLSSGVYFYELDAPGYTAARKLVLLE